MTVTLMEAQRKDELWQRVAEALRELPDVRQVVVSHANREVVIIGTDYEFVALRDVS